MFNWPWAKKKEPLKQINKVVQPPINLIKQFAEGVGDCQEYLPYQYVNWGYSYLGMDVEVYAGGLVYNKHIIYLTQACILYLEENEE